jgi:hypothetical protein
MKSEVKTIWDPTRLRIVRIGISCKRNCVQIFRQHAWFGQWITMCIFYVYISKQNFMRSSPHRVQDLVRFLSYLGALLLSWSNWNQISVVVASLKQVLCNMSSREFRVSRFYMPYFLMAFLAYSVGTWSGSLGELFFKLQCWTVI